MLQVIILALFWSLRVCAIPVEEPKAHKWAITWEPYAPDGFSRHMLLVNGQSPGPTLEANQDDWVVVDVANNSPFNTSVHFHGIEMLDTPWSDGVPGVTQIPIPPGGNFTYRFKASQHGSYWYHSHTLDQMEDGLYGPIVLHPRKDIPKPFHLISDKKVAIDAMERAERNLTPLILNDYMHITSIEKWDLTPKVGVEFPCYDSILFNGKGSVNCLPEEEMMAHLGPVQKADLDLVPGSTLTDKGCLPARVMAAFGGNPEAFNPSALPKGIFEGCNPTNGSTEIIKADTPSDNSWIAIDIIGAMNFVVGTISVDEHDMWVYAVDGSYIEPQKVQAITIFNGDRFSVLIKTKKSGNFKIRLNAQTAPQTINGHAILSVAESTTSNATESKPYIDIIGQPLSKDVTMFNETIAYPYPPDPIAQIADSTYVLHMKLDGASYLWALNSTRLDPHTVETDTPALFHPETMKENNVTVRNLNDTWVDLVLFASVFPMPPHPIHKHGVKMFLLGSGTGPFRWNSVEQAAKEIPEQFNLKNPPRRDTFASPVARKDYAWTVVRYHVTNPGAWLLHCHISNHMMGGMMMVVMDGVDAMPTIPPEYLNYNGHMSVG